MNDKLIVAATESMETARGHVIKKIEKMEEDDETGKDQPKSRHRVTKDFVVKCTGSFLSRTVLPILKRKEVAASTATSVDSAWGPLDEPTVTDDHTNTDVVLADAESDNEDADEQQLDGPFVMVQETQIVD